MDNVFKAMGLRLTQRINEWVDAWTPRQAFVTRSAGRDVWVRFANEGADEPESQFPTTVAGVAAGTTGWVFTLGGKKGLFVATGVPKPDANSNGTGSQSPISTSGDYPITAAAATISGLAPGSTRKVIGTVSYRATSTSGQASMGMQMIGSATAFFGPGTIVISSSSVGNDLYTFTYSTTMTVAPDGTLSVRPCVRWSAGTIYVSGAFATIQLL